MLRLHLRTASAGLLPARAAAEVYKGLSRAEPGGLTVVARLLPVTHRAVRHRDVNDPAGDEHTAPLIADGRSPTSLADVVRFGSRRRRRSSVA